MISHETPSSCPHCGYVIELSTGLFDSEAHKPKEGDISICITCGKVSVFTAESTLRKPTPDEAATITADKRVLEAQIVRSGVVGGEGRAA